MQNEEDYHLERHAAHCMETVHFALWLSPGVTWSFHLERAQNYSLEMINLTSVFFDFEKQWEQSELSTEEFARKKVNSQFKGDFCVCANIT